MAPGLEGKSEGNRWYNVLLALYFRACQITLILQTAVDL
jgi:hypothetical protein